MLKIYESQPISKKINVYKFLRDNQISDDYLVYKFKLSTFRDGPTGFIERIIECLGEYSVPVDENILIRILSQVRQLNILLHEKKFWDKVELKPRISGGYELIFEYLIKIFIPFFLVSLGINLGKAIPHIIEKKAEAKIEIEKQIEIKNLEIEVFKKKVEALKMLTVVKGSTHEDLLRDIAMEFSKTAQSPDVEEYILELLEMIEGGDD